MKTLTLTQEEIEQLVEGLELAKSHCLPPFETPSDKDVRAYSTIDALIEKLQAKEEREGLDKVEIRIPSGYRELKEGEDIKHGDWFAFPITKKWYQVVAIRKYIKGVSNIHIRPIE